MVFRIILCECRKNCFHNMLIIDIEHNDEWKIFGYIEEWLFL